MVDLRLVAENRASFDEIYYDLRRSVFPLPARSTNDAAPSAEVVSLVANLAQLGFVPSADVVRNWTETSKTDLVGFGKRLLAILRASVGAHVVHRAFYPNFPQQVLEASDAELFLNAVLHYFGDAITDCSGGALSLRILPEYEELVRPVLPSKDVVLKPIELGSFEDLVDAARALLGSSQAFSPSQAEAVKVLLGDVSKDQAGMFWDAVPARLGNKENAAFIAALALRSKANPDFDFSAHLTTATDALRLAVALSEGDVSLATKTRFASFSRRARRVLLSIIDASSGAQEDMWNRRETFKRLGERLHPGEFANIFPRAAQAFALVRNRNASFTTFNSRVESLVEDGMTVAAADLLAQRPGLLARRLNELLSKSASQQSRLGVVQTFAHVADQVSTTVLLQVRSYFEERGEKKPARLFLPKGRVARAMIVEDNRVPLPQIVRKRVIDAVDAALVERFGELDKLGKVWIDPAVQDMTIPFGVRSASPGMQVVGRGSMLPFGNEDKDVLRFFIHWKDRAGISRVDIDLSAIGLDENFTPISNVGYYNLRDQFTVHSGDITSAPDGASEFIDVDIPNMLKRGVRYVAMAVYSYTRDPFSLVPECFAGFMSRSDMRSGEIYDARTVENKVDLISASISSIPFVFDLQERKAIWVDLSIHPDSLGNNAFAGESAATSLVNAVIANKGASLYSLFALHAAARGELVTDRDEADFVFAVDGDVSPFDVAKILGEDFIPFRD